MTTFDELLEKSRKHQRTHNPDREHDLQVVCVEWFRYQYPRLTMRLFAVPNGGYRDRKTASKLKDEGVVDLDEERKAAMVSNLLVVLCGDEPAQPVVNSGSLY